METDREAGKAQTGSETVQFSGGEGQGSEGLVGAVTGLEKVEEGHLAEPDTKLQQRFEVSPCCTAESWVVGTRVPRLSAAFSKIVFQQIPPPHINS